ncbi:CU044_2847 family protein [Micromonospora sp. NPDC002296]|uniref:CU044_2847 family protein n=1 Tax=Micromonospora sp. NPDC002296 TaxID=3154271 RepID=UPI00331EFADE
MRELVQVELPDGQIAWALIENEGVRDVAFGASLLSLTGLSETLTAVATNVRRGVAAAQPDEVAVEFGLDLEFGGKGLVAALAGSSAKAALKVTLTWKPSGRRPEATPPEGARPGE